MEKQTPIRNGEKTQGIHSMNASHEGNDQTGVMN
jgi:hypothetical protein